VAKQGGLGDTAYVDGYDLGGDITAIGSIGGGPATGDVTSIKKSAIERIGLLRDGRIEFTSAFNDDPGPGSSTGAHPVLKTLPTSDRLVTYFRGQAVGSPAVSLVAKQINYDGTRGTDGSLFFSVSAQGSGYGLQWGEQLTAGLKTDTAASNGTGTDFGAVSTAFGWTAYVHLTAFTGTSVTFNVQDSADNVTFATLSGGSFGAMTGIGAARLTGGLTDTVRRYVRINTSGTFSNAVFAVNFVRYLTAQS